ncbi:hypothetical protein KQY10_13500 [Leptospira interrogans]|uniref:Uncharacterized protein n=1 Tax=Leptospira interrogans serovar Hardjo str. Norma TaxID=1279460 RepID=A0A0M4N7A5_LEPIR|nr:hypothetical protein [Leptospira interrogans]ALE40394.1 hypothetical protein G436_3236 [Leptospira interrogans serovar Hardjo str. Norma]EKO95972.1 hypothetical protein LEP1GSC057_4656 [Leptospira interrogans str. Brem 329]MCD1166597.1 hypothetical protein [Leptospira interrogans]MCH1887178.1 hypothetical protein [Leptospira interrogans]MCH1893486.1 hypothetical protein [Leptospira interrogans]
MTAENLQKAIEEVHSLMSRMSQKRKDLIEDESYILEIKMYLSRFDLLYKYIEDKLSLNKLRSLAYPFTISSNNEIHEIFIPAMNASSYISGLNRAVKTINPKTNLYLSNILRGSTILCFEYSEDNYLDEKFNKVETSTILSDLCQALNETESTAIAEVEKIVKGKTKRESILRSLRSLTPIIGESDIETILEMNYIEKPIILNSEIRKTINTIVPTSIPKNANVDWENNLAIGYIREINNVSKSFILYNNNSYDDNTEALIKVFYKDETIEDELLNKFTDKVTIDFKKENRRYILSKIR